MADGYILLVDGECVLCNRITRFVIRHDRRGKFRFAALQSAAARRLLDEAFTRQEMGRSSLADSFIFIEHHHAYVRSTAALRVLRRLGGPWKLLYAAIVVPEAWRDHVYRFIAERRYRWFGKQERCELPDARLRGRLLEGGEER